MEDSSGENSNGSNPPRQSQHQTTIRYTRDNPQQHAVDYPRSIEEMQNNYWRQHFLEMTAGGGLNLPQNAFVGAGNSAGSGGSQDISLAPPSSFSAGFSSSAGPHVFGAGSFPISAVGNNNERMQTFSSPSASIGMQFQQQQQQSLVLQFAALQQQQDESSVTLQQQLRQLQQQQGHLQDQHQFQQQQQVQQQLSTMDTGHFGLNNVALQQLQGQQPHHLTENYSLLDTMHSNSFQAVQGTPLNLGASNAGFNQLMWRISGGDTGSSSGFGQSPSLHTNTAVLGISNAPTSNLNQSSFTADSSSFLGKIPGQDISRPTGQSSIENTRLSNSISNLNFDPSLSSLSSISGMRLPVQLHPEGILGSGRSTASNASRMDTPSQEMKVQASSPSASSSKGTRPPVLKPLSAYNYFFTEERDRILHGDTPYGNETNDARKLRLLSMHWSKDRNKRRPHRKTHGKISFTTLSRHIGQKWRELGEEEKNFYKSVANADMLQRSKISIAKNHIFCAEWIEHPNTSDGITMKFHTRESSLEEHGKVYTDNIINPKFAANGDRREKLKSVAPPPIIYNGLPG
ncbi:HMG high mobility group box-containing protein [Nitzschia inconspicua]|uniref:HMG high mobility group box-containing protein n=1 Tax=Nitzschia inconspicua TaxID=303405 RepID=A0A9K3KQT3_9STRA|nr:HMG high mobility group box-containing protein [Nitzschia inconspicua]